MGDVLRVDGSERARIEVIGCQYLVRAADQNGGVVEAVQHACRSQRRFVRGDDLHVCQFCQGFVPIVSRNGLVCQQLFEEGPRCA